MKLEHFLTPYTKIISKSDLLNSLQPKMKKKVKKKKCKKAKWLSEEALQIVEKIRDMKNKGERE